MDNVVFKKKKEASGKKDLLEVENGIASVWFQKRLGHSLQDTLLRTSTRAAQRGGGRAGQTGPSWNPGTKVTGEMRSAESRLV